MLQPCRVACVRYLNTAPLIEGLEVLDTVKLLPKVPADIAGAVRSGDADIGLASVVDGATPGLTLLGAGMIGCDGPTHTVRIFSSVPPEQITRLHADADSHTSVVLARVLLARRFGTTVSIVPHKAGADDSPEAVLLIGDKVVTNPPAAARYPHQLDLGDAWHAWTGLPFVYAAWMCRDGEETSPRITTGAAILDRQRRHNATRLEWIIQKRAAAARWPTDLARTYLTELLRYDFDGRARAGLDRFIAEAQALGVLSSGTLRYAPGIAPHATTTATPAAT
ncbi:MAG: menaquinone biosynthesis protein [Phycisphaerales bacterium]|jgi:chorismate dehydratase